MYVCVYVCKQLILLIDVVVVYTVAAHKLPSRLALWHATSSIRESVSANELRIKGKGGVFCLCDIGLK